MLDRPNLYSSNGIDKMYSSSSSSTSSSKSRPRLISISEAYRNLAQLISQRDVPLKLSLNKDREVVSLFFEIYVETFTLKAFVNKMEIVWRFLVP